MRKALAHTREMRMKKGLIPWASMPQVGVGLHPGVESPLLFCLAFVVCSFDCLLDGVVQFQGF